MIVQIGWSVAAAQARNGITALPLFIGAQGLTQLIDTCGNADIQQVGIVARLYGGKLPADMLGTAATAIVDAHLQWLAKLAGLRCMPHADLQLGDLTLMP